MPDTCATPVATPEAGTYTSAQSVALVSATVPASGDFTFASVTTIPVGSQIKATSGTTTYSSPSDIVASITALGQVEVVL